MIENVFSNVAGKEEEYQVSGRKPPKNVRQAGYFTGDLRIYVEDYVHTFTHWLAEQDYSRRCIAVLVGEFAKSEHTRDVYAYGTVVIEDACADGRIEMTSEIWTHIYETIKKYFSEGEIVGWFYGGTSFMEEEKEMLSQVHLDYFAGTDRILMLYDFLEREEEFYRYEGEGLVRQSGYYIYYEKNTEMQNYMIDKKQGKNVHEEIEDRAVKEVRAKLNISAQPKKETEEQAEGEEKKTSQETPGSSKLLYTAGIVMAAVAVITGASMIYNQERMKGFEQTLNQIIGAVWENEENTPGANGNTETADVGHGSIFDDPAAQETFQNNSKPGNASEDAGKPDENPPDGTKSPTGAENQDEAEDSGKTKDSNGEEDADNAKDPNGEEDSDKAKDIGGAKDAGKEGQDGDIEKTGGNNKEENNTDGGSDAKAAQEGKGSPPDDADSPENDAGNDNIPKEGGDTAEASKGTDDALVDTSNYTVYTVQPGDTLVGICMRIYGSIENLDYIKALNQINNENLIYAYQELLLP